MGGQEEDIGKTRRVTELRIDLCARTLCLAQMNKVNVNQAKMATAL